MSVYVAIPCMDMVQTEFFKNILLLKTPPKTAYGITVASLTYDARNTLAKAFLESDADRILWLDSDMVFPSDIIEKLSEDIDRGKDFVSALYFTRKNPIKPVIFNDIGYRDLPDGLKESYAKFYTDYPRNEVFEVEAAGFGACMMTKTLMKKVSEVYGGPFMPIPGLGEDISFCRRARAIGFPLFCDSRIKAGHIASAVITEQHFDGGITI